MSSISNDTGKGGEPYVSDQYQANAATDVLSNVELPGMEHGFGCIAACVCTISRFLMGFVRRPKPFARELATSFWFLFKTGLHPQHRIRHDIWNG